MKKLCTTELYNHNALVKLLVLGNLIQCNLTRISNRVKIASSNINLLQEDIIDQIRCIKNFVDNLKEARLAWNGRLFKFLNNIFFFQVYLQEVISATEHAFLACGVRFQNIHQSNLQSKHQTIERQLELLEMQKTVMKFAHQVCGAEYLLYFYFKVPTNNEFICYNTIERNQNRFKNGDVLNIIEGIPLNEALKYNDSRKLKLEAIPLEFLANQRKPEEADYQRAISGKELEQYLQKWEKEDRAKAEALEEKQHRTPTKKLKFKKPSVETKAEKPNKVIVIKTTPKRSADPLTKKMDELILLLNPRVFSAQKVKQVITELNQYTFESVDDEQVFTALSTIGDSYSMIAGHHLNRSNKNPEDLIVNLKLAINFYCRAELVLSKHSPETMEKHAHYYTWLQHSVGIQCNLLAEYTRKFTHKHEQLLASRERRKQELGDEWYTRHLTPGWKMSPIALQTQALQKAVRAIEVPAVSDHIAERAQQAIRPVQKDYISSTMKALQEECRKLYNLIQKKITGLAANLPHAYSFEHYLKSTEKRQLPEQQLSYKFNEPVAPQEVVVVAAPESAAPALANESVTFTRIVDLNPWGDQAKPQNSLPRPLPQPQFAYSPVFKFPYLIMPSALSPNSAAYDHHPNEIDISYITQGWALQPLQAKDAAYEALKNHLRFPQQGAQDPYQPQFTYPVQRYVPPFASTTVHNQSYTATELVSPPQPLTFTVEPKLLEAYRKRQSTNSRGQDRGVEASV